MVIHASNPSPHKAEAGANLGYIVTLQYCLKINKLNTYIKEKPGQTWWLKPVIPPEIGRIEV
jgi:hypothetical protein